MVESKLAQKSTTRGAWLGILTFIVTFTLVVAFWYNTPIISTRQHPANDCKATEGSQRMTSMVFRENAEYKNLSHAHDQLWEDLVSPNGGFIVVTSEDQSRHLYGISMYHQLHCLAMIRSAVQDLQSQIEAASPAEHGHENMHHAHARHSDSGNHLRPSHWLHCFDYLRQTILCNADGTVELPSISPSGEELIHGEGERQCRDWTRLRDLSMRQDVQAESISAFV